MNEMNEIDERSEMGEMRGINENQSESNATKLNRTKSNEWMEE